MAGIEITRVELTPSDLRASAGKARDAKAARRMLALALVPEGVDRTRAVPRCGMDRQTLRDWVHRTNAEGLAGLSDRGKAVRVPRLAPARMAELPASARGRAGPRAGRGGALAQAAPSAPDCHRVRHRGAGAQGRPALGGKSLAALGYRRLSVRPQHPRTDPDAQEAFKKLPRGGSGGDPRGRARQTAGTLVSR